jgi:hypothetical protein
MLQNSGDMVQKEKDHVEEQWRHGAKGEGEGACLHCSST